MNRMIFVNLPVADLQTSIAFYEAVGATADPHFKGDGAQMMRFSDDICVMLASHARFDGFLEGTRARIDPKQGAQAIFCLSADSREEVDAVAAAAAGTGADVDITPADDYGYMYGRNFVDPDGHVWQMSWMDVEAAMAADKESA